MQCYIQKNFVMDKSIALHSNQSNFDKRMTLSNKTIKDLEWWKKTINLFF